MKPWMWLTIAILASFGALLLLWEPLLMLAAKGITAAVFLLVWIFSRFGG